MIKQTTNQKLNEYILIVEDEAVLYHRMKKILTKESFEVSNYIPSVEEALQSINERRPDLVLLDIKLQGDLTGIDLGKILYNDYQIPFIYVTDFDNDMLFAKALETRHEHYLVKTKPRINANELKRAIYTALQKNNKDKQKNNQNKKLGIQVLVNYLDILKNLRSNDITRKNISFEDIAFFTGDVKFLKEYNTEFRKNYIWLLTKEHKLYYLKISLKKLCENLPKNFVRVNDHYIINLKPPYFEGRINKKKIRVYGEDINIGDSYRNDFNNKYESFYLT